MKQEKQEEKINWNMSDYYCQYLLLIIKRVDYWLISENYELVWKEFSNVHAQLSGSIESCTDKNINQNIDDKLSVLGNLVKEYKYISLMPKSIIRVRKEIKVKHDLQVKCHELYKVIMNTIDAMGLLFQKEIVDRRLSIYKQ